MFRTFKITQHNTTKRDAGVELFRCCIMFGICLLHALDQGGYAASHRGLDNLMWPCVDGFIFISGYYGLKMRLSSVLRIVGIGVYCSSIIALIYDGLVLKATPSAVLLAAYSYLSHAWFLWTYVALMLAVPLLDGLFNESNYDSKHELWQQVLPFLVMVFGWSYAATTIPVLKKFVPQVCGFDCFGLLTFIGVYVAARTSRYYKIEDKVSSSQLLITALISAVFCWFNLMHYHSPFALLFAGALFYLFKRRCLRECWAGKVAVIIAPSMFSVYLLHMNPGGMAWLKVTED